MKAVYFLAAHSKLAPVSVTHDPVQLGIQERDLYKQKWLMWTLGPQDQHRNKHTHTQTHAVWCHISSPDHCTWGRQGQMSVCWHVRVCMCVCVGVCVCWHVSVCVAVVAVSEWAVTVAGHVDHRF